MRLVYKVVNGHPLDKGERAEAEGLGWVKVAKETDPVEMSEEFAANVRQAKENPDPTGSGILQVPPNFKPFEVK
jgi:hypothetical protein